MRVDAQHDLGTACGEAGATGVKDVAPPGRLRNQHRPHLGERLQQGLAVDHV